MPQRGWLCVFSGEKKAFGECIECSKGPRHCEFPPEMLISMRKGLYPRGPDYISITRAFADCLRQVVLEIFFDYWVSPRKNYYAFRGNLIHGMLAGIRERDAWKEITWSRPVEVDGKTVEVWGTVDKIVPRQRLIRDFKTTAAVPRGNEPYGHHAEQLNGYRWIWYPVLGDMDKLRLQYIDMRQTKQIKVPLMDLDKIEQKIKSWVREYTRVIESETIPPGKYDQKNWWCKYCDLVDVCKEIAELEDSYGTQDVGTLRVKRKSPKSEKGIGQ